MICVNAEWGNFFVITGGASGALTGLVFVAVSLQAEAIFGSVTLRKAAGQALILLVTPLWVAAIMTVPAVPEQTRGSFLIVTGLAVGGVLLFIRLGMHPAEEGNLARLLTRIMPNVLTTVPLIIAGVWIVVWGESGVYWLTPAQMVPLIGGVASAWLILMINAKRQGESSGNHIEHP
jgi:uncharacterized membrane protein SirB2